MRKLITQNEEISHYETKTYLHINQIMSGTFHYIQKFDKPSTKH